MEKTLIRKLLYTGLKNGNLSLGEVTTIQPGKYLASDVELIQSGKHPGKNEYN